MHVHTHMLKVTQNFHVPQLFCHTQNLNLG